MDRICRVSWIHWIKKSIFFPCSLPGFLFECSLSLNLDVWDCRTKHLPGELLRKFTFVEVVFLMTPGGQFPKLLLPQRLG